MPTTHGFALARSWPAHANRLLVAGGSAVAGVLHLTVAPGHLGDDPVLGIGMLAVALAQLMSVPSVLLSTSRRLLFAVAAANLAAIAAWAVLHGQAIGHHTREVGHHVVAHSDGASAPVALVAEGVVVAAATALSAQRRSRGRLLLSEAPADQRQR